MNGLQEMVYLSEIVLQSRIAKRAADRLSTTNDDFDEIEVWCSIQSILVAAGNISKILWPQNKNYEARGKELRMLLKVDRCNILFNRKFRNHFEHYDERIEDWFKKQSSLVYWDLEINPFQSIWKIADYSKNRAYNPLRQTITFRGESMILGEVLNAIEDIQLKCSPYTLT